MVVTTEDVYIELYIAGEHVAQTTNSYYFCLYLCVAEYFNYGHDSGLGQIIDLINQSLWAKFAHVRISRHLKSRILAPTHRTFSFYLQ